MNEHDPGQRLAQRMAQECIGVRVRLINRVITGLYDDALRPLGLRISQANVLTAVLHQGEVRPADVCRALRIDKSTLSRDVELLKQQGWIESDPPGGGRNQVLRITAAGREIVRRAQPAWEQAQAQARELIGPDGAAALQQIAARLGFGKVQD